MFYSIARLIVGFIYTVIFRIEVIGLENVPNKGPVIIASNHISNFDPPTIGAALKHRPMGFMAKAELFRIPVFSFVIRKLGAFPVKRGVIDRSSIKIALDRLYAGCVIGIFPEGTRSKDGELKKGVGAGVISIAAKAGATVVPTAVIGTNKLKPRAKIKVIFDKPFHVTGNISDKEILQEQADKLMEKIGLLLMIEKRID